MLSPCGGPIQLTSLVFNLAQHHEQRLLHPVTIERVFPRLSFVQRLFGYIHNLLQNIADVLLLALRSVARVGHAVVLWHHSCVSHHAVRVLHLGNYCTQTTRRGMEKRTHKKLPIKMDIIS